MDSMTDSNAESRRRTPQLGWGIGLGVGLLILPGVILADQRLFALLRPEGMPWLATLMRWGTWLGYGVVDVGIPLLLGAVRWWRRRDGFPRRALLGGVSVLAAGLLDPLVKNLFCRARPGAPGGGAFFTNFPCFPSAHAVSSFPSGHATTAFALATLLSLWYPRWTGAFLVVAALVAWSRIVLGTHFPSDVLGGAILGCATVLGLSLVWSRFGPMDMGNEKRAADSRGPNKNEG